MNGRKTDNITRVDVRIPNELYEQVQAIGEADTARSLLVILTPRFIPAHRFLQGGLLILLEQLEIVSLMQRTMGEVLELLLLEHLLNPPCNNSGVAK